MYNNERRVHQRSRTRLRLPLLTFSSITPLLNHSPFFSSRGSREPLLRLGPIPPLLKDNRLKTSLPPLPLEEGKTVHPAHSPRPTLRAPPSSLLEPLHPLLHPDSVAIVRHVMNALSLRVQERLEDGGSGHGLDDLVGDAAGRERCVAEFDGEGTRLAEIGLVQRVGG